MPHAGPSGPTSKMRARVQLTLSHSLRGALRVTCEPDRACEPDRIPCKPLNAFLRKDGGLNGDLAHLNGDLAHNPDVHSLPGPGILNFRVFSNAHEIDLPARHVPKRASDGNE
jgi:hypothetical protein